MSARPVLVVAVAAEVACRAVLARHDGADIHHLDVVAPGKLLVNLEKLRATHAVMTSVQFDALRNHPAFALADLDALAKVYLVGGGIPQVDTSAPFEIEPIDTPPADDALELEVSIIARDVERRLAGMDHGAGIAASEALARAGLHSMFHGLRRAGAFADANDIMEANDVLTRIQAHPRQRALMRRWLHVLAREGLLIHEGDRYRLAGGDVIEPDWDEVERLWRAAGEGRTTLAFAREVDAALPALIDGRTQAVHLLFPQGDLERARALYRESVAARYQHAAVASSVAHIAQTMAGRRLRILEVGGGTGATTDQVVPALADVDGDCLFTDVSSFFAGQIRVRHPSLRTGVYDIDRPPDVQGYVPGGFDIVVAGGVLNAARDTDASLRWLASLLAPGGWLVLSEPTTEEYWVMASQAFMLAEPDDERAGSGATFLSHEQWLTALAGAGFRTAVDLPAASHPLAALGHRVFAARPDPRP